VDMTFVEKETGVVAETVVPNATGLAVLTMVLYVTGVET